MLSTVSFGHERKAGNRNWELYRPNAFAMGGDPCSKNPCGKVRNPGENTHPLLVGLQAGTTTLETSLVVPQKTVHSTT